MKNNLNFGTLIEKDINKYHFHVGTDFQKLVWSEIAKIPKGKILTYEQLALKINCPIKQAPNKLNSFFKKNKINIRVQDNYFPVSKNKLGKLNVKYSSAFGRQLEYYTGLVFKIEIREKSKNKNIINGGRYDNLISDLGSIKKIPAVGAAFNLNY